MIDDERKQKLLEELEKIGNVYSSCFRASISRAQYYRWMKTNEDFRKKAKRAIMLGRENMCDVAENALMQRVTKERDLKAIVYVLNNNSKRYKQEKMKYADRKQLLSSISDEEFNKLAKDRILPPVKIKIIEPKDRPTITN